ncbi:sugar:sodium symporter [Treponema ruminis]|uniref:Melibiose permease n=1 Tax=Treponema ruminis TaxID=744515 RepID=A0A7W8LLT0_9SPIR|nr:glycoside-pentoside-hexuronide (GPH):cation symporter [Treponema ruminis]MBB5225797.1 melibiose permease [Treponema ruminis]QSI02486.1 sugar:sodium symporter [Treponema ruminis]
MLGLKEKTSYGLGAVGKDMVYMLSASYILYYFQDILGVSAVAMGVILLVARIFDAFNDPIMGVVVAKTKSRWGKFRPWLLIGTLTNAVVLFLMFAAPPALDASGLVAYAAVTYILWGVTYTMMDIPYWSMIPAFTNGGKEREGLTTLARSCAGVGSAIISILTMIIVPLLGNMFAGQVPAELASRYPGKQWIELAGFKYFTLGVAVLFVLFTLIMCLTIKEKSSVDMKTAKIREMFRALLQNDQAMCVVLTIVVINVALYITSNLVIYFFKYDLGGTNWNDGYALFNMVGGGTQILAMMILYPLLRNLLKLNNIKIFYVSVGMSITGYIALLAMASLGVSSVVPFLIPGVLVMASAGVNNVIITVFLANTVDYGDLKNHRRDESVIFSMQTFVVKLASGISAFIASIALSILNLKQITDCGQNMNIDFSEGVSAASKMGLRMVMTLVPIFVLICGAIIFKSKFILTDKKVEEISEELKARG